MNPPTESNSDDIAEKLLNGPVEDEPLALDLEELGTLFKRVATAIGSSPLLRVVSLHDRLMVQFPEVSTQKLYVVLRAEQRSKEALSFVTRLEWFGPDKPPLTLRGFLASEVRSRFPFFLLLYAAAFLVLSLIGDLGVMRTLNALAITSLSIFVGIFGVFVIGESKRMGERMELFTSGWLHDFLETDRMMLNLALLTLLLGFVNAALLSLPYDLAVVRGFIDRPRLWGPLMTTTILVLLFDLFLAIPNYYLRRLQAVLERDAVRDLLRGPSSEDSENGTHEG